MERFRSLLPEHPKRNSCSTRFDMTVSDGILDPKTITPDQSTDPAQVLQRGIELYRARRYADAMQEFSIAFGLDAEESTALYWMACIHFHERRYNDAIQLVRRHLSIHPADAAAHLVMGKALLELGRPEEARSHLMRSAELNRTHTVDMAMQRCNQALSQMAEATGAKPNYTNIVWSEVPIPNHSSFASIQRSLHNCSRLLWTASSCMYAWFSHWCAGRS
jgi:tetratricopeptide (TPR) repeat protein